MTSIMGHCQCQLDMSSREPAVRCWTEAPDAGEVGISLLSGRHLGTELWQVDITISVQYQFNMFNLFMTIYHQHQNMSHYMMISSWHFFFRHFREFTVTWRSFNIPPEAMACSSRTSSSQMSRDRPKIWVFGSQQVAKDWDHNLHNLECDLNLAHLGTMPTLSSISPTSPISPYVQRS